MGKQCLLLLVGAHTLVRHSEQFGNVSREVILQMYLQTCKCRWSRICITALLEEQRLETIQNPRPSTGTGSATYVMLFQ